MINRYRLASLTEGRSVLSADWTVFIELIPSLRSVTNSGPGDVRFLVQLTGKLLTEHSISLITDPV